MTTPRQSQPAKVWNARVDSWHHQVTDSPAFADIRAAVLAAAAPAPGLQMADLGCGTGFLTVPLATAGAVVTAVDASVGMLDVLRRAEAAPGEIHCVEADLAQLQLPEASLDVVVSSYALHHLTHPEKRALLARSYRWMRPGGRLVLADMMFGRGGSSRDRRILADKSLRMLRKGPAGLLRLSRNVVRLGLKVGVEQPASPEFWQRAARDAGFDGVSFQPLVAEAGLVLGYKPR